MSEKMERMMHQLEHAMPLAKCFAWGYHVGRLGLEMTTPYSKPGEEYKRSAWCLGYGYGKDDRHRDQPRSEERP